MKKRRLVLCVLWVLLLIPVPTIQAQVEEEKAILLGAFRQEMPGFAFSRDGMHAILGFAKDGKEYYEVDGKPGEQYEDCTRPEFSSDSKHWAYAGKKDGKWWVITDQSKYGPYDGVGRYTAPCVWMKGGGFTVGRALICEFSSDGKHFALAAVKGDDWVVYWDGKPLGNFQSIGINSLAIDPTGNRFAFCGKQAGKWYLVLDGKRLEPASDDLAHDWCVFSPDGQHVLWAVKQGTQELLLMDGKRVAAGGKVKKPIYSPDGSLWIAAITRGGKSFLLSNGKEGLGYEKILDVPILSPDGKHVALAAKSGGKVFVMRDNEKGPEFASISWLSGEWVFGGESPPVLRFSSDSRRLAYAAKHAEKENFAVVDDKQYGPYETIVTMKFSPDSKHFGFLVKKSEKDSKDAKYSVIVDGEQSQWYDQASFLVFSENGKHCAYACKTGEGWMVVVDGSLLNTKYKDINSLVFGPKGNLIISATLLSEQSIVLVDGSAGREWDEISMISSENFDETGTLYYLAVSKDKLYRVARVATVTSSSHGELKQPNLKSKDPSERAMGARRIAETGHYNPGDIDLLIACFTDRTSLFPSDVVFPMSGHPLETTPSNEAEKALVRIGRPAVPKLIEDLNQMESDFRRAPAARCLGDIGDKSAVPHLTRLAEKGVYGRPHVRGQGDEIPVAIAKILRKDAYKILAGVYQEAETSKRLNSRLFEALGYSQDERFIPVLQKHLQDGDRYRKLDILIALGHTASEKAIPLLLPYVNSEDGHMRWFSRDSLKELGRKDLIPKENTGDNMPDAGDGK